MDEIYTKIKGFENYAISNHGNVFNIQTQKFLKHHYDKDGYKYINISIPKKTTMKIHRLIALHFIDNLNNYSIVDHIDRDITNNSILNLRWTTSQINNRNKSKKINATSKYTGVVFKNNRWITELSIYGTKKYIGCFKTEIEAAQSWNKYVIDNQLEGYVLNEC